VTVGAAIGVTAIGVAVTSGEERGDRVAGAARRAPIPALLAASGSTSAELRQNGAVSTHDPLAPQAVIESVQPDALVDPRPRYSQGLKTTGGSMLFIAGQVAADATGQIVGAGNIDQQVEQVFENLRAMLTAAGGSFDNLVMTTTYLTDIAYREAFSKVRLRYYSATRPPANTLVVVKALANPEYLIEIDGIAVI
jgi:enamine deaminase RidA (YjgF/YER057c/UK114 family)